MAYKRRASQVITDAQERATNLKAIDPALDLGSGLTVTAFDSEIAGVGVMFDKNSSEYEMAGGTRTSEIKRGKKKEEQEE